MLAPSALLCLFAAANVTKLTPLTLCSQHVSISDRIWYTLWTLHYNSSRGFETCAYEQAVQNMGSRSQ